MTTQNFVLLALALAFAFLVLRPLLFGAPRVTAADAAARLNAGTAVLVDVREPGEWSGGVATPAALLPMSELGEPSARWKTFLEANRDKEVILYCASGMRSGSVAGRLKKQGFRTANLGGFGAWAGAGLPTRRP